MPLVSIPEISRLYLVAVAEQTGLSHTWSKISEDMFSRDVAQLLTVPDQLVIFRLNITIISKHQTDVDVSTLVTKCLCRDGNVFSRNASCLQTSHG